MQPKVANTWRILRSGESRISHRQLHEESGRGMDCVGCGIKRRPRTKHAIPHSPRAPRRPVRKPVTGTRTPAQTSLRMLAARPLLRLRMPGGVLRLRYAPGTPPSGSRRGRRPQRSDAPGFTGIHTGGPGTAAPSFPMAPAEHHHLPCAGVRWMCCLRQLVTASERRRNMASFWPLQ